MTRPDPAATAAAIAGLKALHAPSLGQRLDDLGRGLHAAAEILATLRRRRSPRAAEDLAAQLAGLHREAQRLAHALSDGGRDG